MEPDGSKEPATSFCPEPDESTPDIHAVFF
jgi:hypothetical protein